MTFNDWRQQYDSMTFEQQQDYHDHLEGLYPDQAHYDIEAAAHVMAWLKPLTVIEAGAWKGNLAQTILSVDPTIYSWEAYELCPAAVRKTVCKDVRFIYRDFNRFDWWNVKPIVCDLFLATHFIEHLSFAHLSEMVKAISAKHIYFEAPLTEMGENWSDFHGTHKLEVGWNRVAELLAEKGYKKIDITHHCKLFER
jgi:hypothetical protein